VTRTGSEGRIRAMLYQALPLILITTVFVVAIIISWKVH
jgi:hypothetical protein